MEKYRGFILALAIAAAISTTALPCPAGEKDKKDNNTEQDIFEDEQREQRTGRRRGRRRFELTEDETNRVMEDFKKRNPKKAKELAGLRKKNPEKFTNELWEHAREELEKIGRERWEKWLRERRAAFLKWLEENVPGETRDLARLKNAEPDLYNKKYELVRRKYSRIFDESRRNPEWARVLLEDVKLQNRRNELVAKIKATNNKQVEKKLTTELEVVIALRYDVILKQKQMALERLLKRLEDLRNQIRDSQDDIHKYQDPQTKEANIKQRAKELLEEKKKSLWD
jgi:hypothetical protein